MLAVFQVIFLRGSRLLSAIFSHQTRSCFSADGCVKERTRRSTTGVRLCSSTQHTDSFYVLVRFFECYELFNMVSSTVSSISAAKTVISQLHSAPCPLISLIFLLPLLFLRFDRILEWI